MHHFEPIDLGDFEKRTGIRANEASIWHEADRIVSLRQMAEVLDVRAMRDDYLGRLMDSVTLLGDPSVHPYRGCRISSYQLDPRMSKVGQTFVERKKILALHERFDQVFTGFSSSIPRGIANKGAYIVLGRTADGATAIAHYLPPIIEHFDGRHHVLDGIHRFSYVTGVGATIVVIKIEDPSSPFPCDPRKWDDVRAVDEKPPKDQRFFGLRPELFRDLKHIGIDG
jgi:hypothetical protein